MHPKYKKVWQEKSIEELKRKAKKARRKSVWTAEDIFYGRKKGRGII